MQQFDIARSENGRKVLRPELIRYHLVLKRIMVFMGRVITSYICVQPVSSCLYCDVVTGVEFILTI